MVKLLFYHFKLYWAAYRGMSKVLKRHPTTVFGKRVEIYNQEKLFLGEKVSVQNNVILHCGGAAWCNYEGSILLNDVSLRDLNIDVYRNIIGDNLLQDEIFEGTIEDNILMGRNGIEFKEVIKALKIVGLTDFIAQLTDGLQSNLLSAGTNFPKSIIQKILLARSIVQKPKLLIIDDFFYNMNQKENSLLLDYIFENKDWALIMVTSQDSMMKRCDKIFIMNNGSIVETGTYDELMASSSLNNFLN